MPEAMSIDPSRVDNHRPLFRPVVHPASHPVSAGTAAALSTRAVLCLYKEVSLYPKPGLVSPVDSGSHKDMDYQMFLASINSLRQYFLKIAAAGASGASFATLQKLGVVAETQMMRATRGVNTHRGAIFNLGLLCAAAGLLVNRCERVTPQALAVVIADHWGAEILATGDRKAYAEYSHGQQVESKYGVHGARHEAVAGFPAARHHGLPAYRVALAETGCREAAAVQALFALMACLDDTNILWRAGADGLRYVKGVAQAFLDAGGVCADGWKARAVNIHHEFVQKNLSPGGAADLLGVTLFMNAICD
jgi:triphosphoribosyl-dephospho-CoA synthase